MSSDLFSSQLDFPLCVNNFAFNENKSTSSIWFSYSFSPLTLTLVGYPRYCAAIPVFRGPQDISKPNSCPSLLLSSSPSLSFHSPLQNCRRHARGSGDMVIPFSPWIGDHHAFQLHPRSRCEHPHSSHGLSRKCAEASDSISSQGLGSFFQILL